MRTNTVALLLAFFVASLSGLHATSAIPRQEFPDARPEDVGLSTAALKELDSVIDGYVQSGETVGAELLVIKDRKTVWHTGHGFSDQEAKTKLQPGAIFCMRSMTKPFIGTAIQILMDDGKLSGTDKASKFLPSFDSESHRDITINQLLTHSSGLQLSSLLLHDYKKLNSVQDVANLAADSTLESEPGTRFNYSDDGTDTLTAIVEKVAGMTAAEFIQKRILDPVGLHNTMPVAAKDDPRRARMIPLYVGSKEQWIRFWSPDQEPLFPYFLGSQAMYSSCEDYARFLCLWADQGKVAPRQSGTESQRILSEDAVHRGLSPGFDFDYPTAFTGARVNYARLWMLWLDPSQTPPKKLAFGHGGSDGTQAWMWPEQDLIILYCTQSRGGLTTLTIEKDIQRLILDPLHIPGNTVDSKNTKPSVPVVQLDRSALMGLYDDAQNDSYVAVFDREGKVVIEFPGRFCGTIAPASNPNEWKIELDPASIISFETDANNAVTAMQLKGGGKTKTYPRHHAVPELPAAEAVLHRMLDAHGGTKFATLSGVKRTLSTDLPKLNRNVKQTTVFDKKRFRTEVAPNVGPKQTIASDGSTVWSQTGDAPVTEISGTAKEQAQLEQLPRLFGDWRESYPEITVVGRAKFEEQPVLLVRCVPKSSYPCTMIVSEETGMLIGQTRTAAIPGLGVVGLVVLFSDFREVGGIKVPFKSVVQYAHPMLGDATNTVESCEVVEAPPMSFFQMNQGDAKPK